ncbi:phosphatase [Corynebacterium renale]|nr:phosphatase [Corynebacterium renale]STD02471.1 phosphatase [Corynebacterium renale]
MASNREKDANCAGSGGVTPRFTKKTATMLAMSSNAETAPQPQRRREEVVAFFDLDKTIIHASSAHAFGKDFISHGVVSAKEALILSIAQTGYMISGASAETMANTRDQLAGLIAGKSVADVQAIAQETIHNTVIPTIYAEARDLIAFHQDAGHDVVIISASATDLVKPIAHELGVRDVVATELEVRDGKYTGEVLFFNKGDKKAEAITALADERGYNLNASFAYSDAATDIPMLELVGNPVAVNPDRPLKKHALDNGWEIRTFKNPEPLFSAAAVKEVGIGTGVVAGIAAVTAGALWWAGRQKREGPA